MISELRLWLRVWILFFLPLSLASECQYTYNDESGNRYVRGSGSFPVVTQLMLQHDSMIGKRIEWVVGKETGDGAMFWFAADGERNVWSFRVGPDYNVTFNGRSRIPTQLFLASFEALIPADASELSSPACVGRNRVLYVSKEGELVLREGRGREIKRRRLGLLPDSRIVLNRLRTLAAFYAGATDKRYQHGVLGDDIEGSVLKVVRTRDLSDVSTVHIPSEAVFEGLGPMWADVDGDGQEDLVSTVSSAEVGAAIYTARANGSIISKTPPIGRGFRWRHQLAVAPFSWDDASVNEIASVLTPHLGKIVELHRLRGQELEVVESKAGYASHRLGSRNLDMGVAADTNGDGVPELIVPDADMTRIVALQRAKGSSALAEKWSFWLGDDLSSNVALIPLARGDFAMALGLRRGRVKLFLPRLSP